MKNVLIFPTDDRLGQLSLIQHYNKAGWNVFLPKHGSIDINNDKYTKFTWEKIATWPALLCMNNDFKERNITNYNFPNENSMFGEDFFLKSKNFESLPQDPDLKCNIIDIENDGIKFDAYHTLRGGDRQYEKYLNIAKKYFPNASLVSSSIFDCETLVGNPKNIAKFIPARYDSVKTKNHINIFASDCMLRMFNIKHSHNRNGFASFNHNFHIRHPLEYQIFCEMNKILQNNFGFEIQNYGGNIRGHGADIRYNNGGPTGNYSTISPADAIEKISGLLAVINFKSDDWGGGIFYDCLHTHTPIITTNHYVRVTKSEKYIINGINAILINSPIEAARAVVKLMYDQEYAIKLSEGMKKIKENIFENYWYEWNSFLQNIV